MSCGHVFLSAYTPLRSSCPSRPMFSGFANRSRGRHRHLVRAGDDQDAFNIDELAKRLSSEASKLSRDSRDSFDDEDRDVPPEQPQEQQRGTGLGTRQGASPFGVEDERAQAIALERIGAANFLPSDFVIYQQLGSLQVQQAVAGDVDGTWSDKDATSVTSIVAYAATYESGQPFQSPITVLLKEFLPGSKAAGITELTLLKAIQPLPYVTERWQAASADMADSAVVPALGWFQAPPSQDLPGVDLAIDSLWIVYKWENLRPVVAYPSYQQPSELSQGLSLFPRKLGNTMAKKFRMIRAIVYGMLKAMDAAHTQGVVHGSLGTGSIMVSSLDDTRAGSLVVKFDNFGFGQLFETQDGSPFAYAKAIDCQALGITLAEVVFGSLSAAGPSASTAAAAMQRLMVEVFGNNLSAFREYCLDVDDWAKAVEFLDGADQAGWNMLDGLLQGDQECGALLESPLFEIDIVR